jgi:hypothetical protein
MIFTCGYCNVYLITWPEVGSTRHSKFCYSNTHNITYERRVHDWKKFRRKLTGRTEENEEPRQPGYPMTWRRVETSVTVTANVRWSKYRVTYDVSVHLLWYTHFAHATAICSDQRHSSNWDSSLTRQLGYKHIVCQNFGSTDKLFSL